MLLQEAATSWTLSDTADELTFTGDRELRLAPVPRRSDTPLVWVRAYGLCGDVNVRTPADGEEPPS